MSDERAQAEQAVRQAHERGEIEQAATLGLEQYGREVLTFLIARTGEQAAQEVFSDFLLDYWRGLPGFAFRSSLRTWMYTLARHALLRSKQRGYKRHEVAQQSREFSAAAARVRTQTAAYLQTEVKDRFRALREQLADEDQTLLILRIDRGLGWRELAVVMGEVAEDAPIAELDKAATRLRQRFQSAKAQLRKLAKAEGLLPDGDDD
jgi:RNA polymerase sigma-70 factor (ECF subfamily)